MRPVNMDRLIPAVTNKTDLASRQNITFEGISIKTDEAFLDHLGQYSPSFLRGIGVLFMLSITWRYILLPVYLASYCFQEKVYQAMINGQTGVISGQKPVEWWKVWLAIAAALLPGLVGLLIGLPLLIMGGIGLLPLLAGILLLIPGIIFAVHTYKKAVALESA
jgi:hypothetical protein